VSALPPGLPVVDHHCHLSPSGEGVRAAERFRAAGGTHLFLATQNYAAGAPGSLDDYRTQFETTVALSEKVRAEAGVVAYPVLAPYPVDLIELVARLGRRAAVELQCGALDLAARYVRDRRAVALGEVGHIHFDAPPEAVAAEDEVLRHAFAAARDADCPAVVHSADLDPAGYRALAEEARAAGLPPHRVVKHYARSRWSADERAGITPSYLARRETVRAAVADPAPWFLETDFLDDPRRPGAVLDLATVPRRATAIAADGPAAAERLWVPFVRSVEEVYGWRPEVGDRRPP
jgi:TatD-related deoxyribonuclease